MNSAVWPAYLSTASYHANWYRLYEPHLSPFQTIAVEDGAVVGLANCVPFPLPEGGSLPDEGWDWVLATGIAAREKGIACNALSALSVAIVPEYRRTGLAVEMLTRMKQFARQANLSAMYAPVRPTGKPRYPLQAFDTYCHWTRPDGTPFDPWLRTHVLMGARFVSIAARSMTVSASTDQWQKWTGLRFPQSGAYYLEGGLAPLQIDLDADRVTYLEPNYWMQHPLTAD
ncbi:transferase [Devosia pacifica]|uniref:Transferase n=2 Tax=Devosia pacifica TaxID=1335967 RepID=A0A918S0S0_9HYPH|nr:transferase [Devosia pacifica]